jgi:hypothetical protein
VRIALSEAACRAREGLLAMSVATGLQVMATMMNAEITDLTGSELAYYYVTITRGELYQAKSAEAIRH